MIDPAMMILTNISGRGLLNLNSASQLLQKSNDCVVLLTSKQHYQSVTLGKWLFLQRGDFDCVSVGCAGPATGVGAAGSVCAGVMLPISTLTLQRHDIQCAIAHPRKRADQIEASQRYLRTISCGFTRSGRRPCRRRQRQFLQGHRTSNYERGGTHASASRRGDSTFGRGYLRRLCRL